MSYDDEIKKLESIAVLGTVGSKVLEKEGWVSFVPVKMSKDSSSFSYFSMTEKEMRRVAQDGEMGIMGFRTQSMNELAEMEFPKGHPWLKIRDVLKAELVRAIQAEKECVSEFYEVPKRLGDMGLDDFISQKNMPVELDFSEIGVQKLVHGISRCSR